MTGLKVASLDVTGTLIHCPRMGEIYSEVLARHGIEVTPDDVRRTFPVVWQELDCLTPAGAERFSAYSGGSRAWWGRLIERLCELLEAGTPTLFATKELFHRFEQADAWEIYPDAVASLDRLAGAGMRLAALSNFDERLPRLLGALDLAQRFEAIVASADVGLAKPNPAIFEILLRRFEVAADAAVHIGNSAREDVEGAEAAGLQALLVDRGEGREEALLDAVSGLLQRPDARIAEV